MVTPYFEDRGATIYLGDCREILPALALGGAVDLVLADPPYGDTSLDWDVRDLRWLAVAGPLLAAHGSVWCFGSLRMFMAQAAGIDALGWRLAQDVVWEKHNGSGSAADRFKRVHEGVAQLYPAGSQWNRVYKSPVTTPDAVAKQVRRKKRPQHWGEIGEAHYQSEDGGPRLMRSVIYARSCHGYADHPTQKPVEVLRPLIEYSCPPGGLVLDPTMGAGSTLIAARQLSRGAIGIEIDEGHCESAARRLTTEMAFS